MSRLRILMIEDDREDHLLTRELLLESDADGYEIDWVRTYEEGLEAILRNTHHLCFTDYRMGSHTGLDLLRAAKSHGSKIPILILTGQRDPELDHQALASGAADFLIKGTFSSEILERAIRHALERSRMAGESRYSTSRLAAFGSQVGLALNRHGSAQQVLQCCAEAIASYLSTELVQIHVFNPKRGELDLTASAGPLNSMAPRMTPAAVDFLHGEPFLSYPALDDHRLTDQEWLTANQIQSAATYPLFIDDHLLGLITLFSTQALTNTVLQQLGSVVPGISSYLARIALQAQVRRTQQLDCVGKMAAGLAHEFKNNLAVIKAHVLQALPFCPKESTIAERLALIDQVTESANGLAQQLMQFARPQLAELKPIDLNKTLNKLKPMIQGALDQRVGIEVRCNATLPTVEADPGMLQQVIINLAVNAKDAMPNGGTITLKTSNVEIDARKAATNPDASVGKFLRVEIQDTGCGMSAETLARLFEPFFTTKPPGKGNGLGLATVFRIIREHRGWIEVVSQVDVGTCFMIYLPECSKPVEEEPTLSLPSPHTELPKCSAPGGVQRTVLVVEDEPVLREVAEMTLRSANYEVIAAASGLEALKAWEARKGKFDVLLTDLSMPEGMTGMQLAAQLTRDNPDLKVILTSGYAPELIENELEGQRPVFIQKPYPPGLLSSTVSKCLGI